MREISLFRPLVLPLIVATSVAMTLCFVVEEPWRSLFVNLAATFLGSIVTVFYVDKILNRREEKRWEQVKAYVGKEVTILANATASSVRGALGIPVPDAWMIAEVANDPVRMRDLMTGLIEQELLPNITDLEDMDQAKWRIFANNLANAAQSTYALISTFGPRLDPEIMALILDLQEKAGQVITPYRILPDMLGIPYEQIKPNRRGESSVPIVKAMVKSSIRDAEQLLRICAGLLRKIGEHFPERSPKTRS